MNDLLVAFACACPFIAIAMLLWNDCAAWLGGLRDQIGAGGFPGDALGERAPTGLAATLTTAAAGADTSRPFDWDTDAA